MAAGDLVTQDGQIEWRGLLLGAGTRYRMQELEGWLDLTDQRDGDVDLDNEHGAHPGQLLSGRRTLTLRVKVAGRTGFVDTLNALRRATTPGENPVEEPLVVQTAGIKAMVMARCVGRVVPQPLEYAAAYAECLLRWRATNPRILRLPQQAPQVVPPVPDGLGLVFPLVFPLVFGGAPSGGELVLDNTGFAAAQPVWRITGPCRGPMITNADTGARLWFDPDLQLLAGQQLDVSTEDKSVLFVGSDISRSSDLLYREWFTLPPGVTRVRFDSADDTGTLTCIYHYTDL